MQSADTMPDDWSGLGVLDLVQAPVWVFDIDRKRVYWANAAALSVWRADVLAELCSRDMGRDMSAAVATRLSQYQADFASHDARFNEQWTLYPGGQPVSLHVHYRGYRLPDGRMAMLCEGRPIGEHSPESLRSVEALLHTPMMIALYALDGQPLYRNPAARASVRRHDERLAQRFVDAAEWHRLERMLADDGQATLTMAVQTAQGERWHEVSARRRLDAVSGEAALLVSEVDVTPLKHSEARALYLSQHDLLTGLPNRTLAQRHFRGLLDHVERSAPRPSLQAAVILIDLDRFKDVNDSWGHAAGDELLVQVAKRLGAVVRGGDMVARFGGDEFLILLCANDIRSEIARIHPRLRQALAQTFMVAGMPVHVSVTIGVSIHPDHGADFETLLQHADLAMYQGKAAGRDTLSFYQPGLSEQLRARTQLEDELREALAHRQFELFYQPRLAGWAGRIVGAEALVRWRHPRRGWVLPAEFIPLCEAVGLIRELGRQVFEMAARQQAAWTAAGHRLRLSVNLSPTEFRDEGLLADLQNTLARTGCPPRMLELEITESMLIDGDDRPLRTLQALQALGLSIALDDFGTGYSNLAYLQRFPFSTLKIDRRFVQASPAERPLCEAIVGLCSAMKLRPVAEGVETASQHDWLLGLGVEEFQGYLFARPMPADEFEHLLGGGVALPGEGREISAQS
ncbi:EAL domain-containing protein [Pseudothauera nasutitermitis]|uniref:EAL domain-containing protein n=1 Tax=Pseudothauera nasutitermitis TaxID=2565930 RepID=A0A4S4AP89_9RHOO|nr:EAL domain-containing protein [Pseudothauera nasutitermitis]THF61453.1 EAL domain-containing protein [Pseudothauera nasutitermitis]